MFLQGSESSWLEPPIPTTIQPPAAAPQLCCVTPRDLSKRCQRCSADGKSSSQRTKAARIQL